MSTYNGSRYIKTQVDSILSNNNFDIDILVRDDGSKDDTIEQLKKLQNKYINQITIIKGKNIGFKKSFLYLMSIVPLSYDYYAFSDQDDYWNSNKLEIAISYLNSINGPGTYCSKVSYVDDNLNEVSGIYSNLDYLPFGIIKPEWAISTSLIALGCTFVWNSKMQDIIVKAPIKEVKTSHDVFMSLISPLVGTLYKDCRETIKYRQHSGNASGNKNIKKYSIKRVISYKKNRDIWEPLFDTRVFIYKYYYNYLNNRNREILDNSILYKKNIKSFIFMITHNYSHGLNKKENLKYFYQIFEHCL